MKKIFLPFLLLSLHLSAQWPYQNKIVDLSEIPFQAILHPGEAVPHEILLMLKPGVAIGEVEERFSANGNVVISQREIAGSMRIWLLHFDDNTSAESALAFGRDFPEVEMAQLNHYVAHRATIPNDAQFGTMWDMNNTGQSGGTPDADIDAPEAWDIATGALTVQGDTIVVAVIDAGFDLAHQDLNFWKNYADIPGNSIDDDNNGYIDDRDGWNAYNSNGNIVSDMHGTHVAGTVGARGNNSVGVVGVGWGVKVMPVMGSDGTEAQVVEAYTYAMDARRRYNQTNGAQGAFVVSTNSSFGVDQGQPSQYPLWCAMYDSMGVVGILSAAATANANWDIDAVGDIPTACASNYMIGVTNTTRNDVKYNSAGYGLTTIDIGAPGTSITSTLPSNLYGQLTGTSMASPHVAGAVALMWSAACSQMVSDYKNDPATLALTMKNYMLSSVDVLSSLNNLCVSNGRLNVYNSVLAVQTYNCTTMAAADQSAQMVLSVFPNPAENEIHVDINLNSADQLTITILDISGKEVNRSTVNAAEGMNHVLLSTGMLSPGTYLLSFTGPAFGTAYSRVVIH